MAVVVTIGARIDYADNKILVEKVTHNEATELAFLAATVDCDEVEES